MLSTDFTALYKYITVDVYGFLIFLITLMLLYGLFCAVVNFITDNIIRIIVAMRAPITYKNGETGKKCTDV